MIDQANRHVYLYAKNHYQHTDVIEDMKQIFSVRNGIDPEYIRTGDMARILLTMTYPYIEAQHQFMEFILDLHPDNYWKCWLESQEQYDFFKAVIGRCLSVLAMTVVFDTKSRKTIMDLGEADPDILPLRREKGGKE